MTHHRCLSTRDLIEKTAATGDRVSPAAPARRWPQIVVCALVLTACGNESAIPRLDGEWKEQPLGASDAVVESYQGSDHCGWQDAYFLHLRGPGAPGDTAAMRQYVRDPDGVVSAELAQQFVASAELPPDATYTGYTDNGIELWSATSDADHYVYLVGASDVGVEAWPLSSPPVGCD